MLDWVPSLGRADPRGIARWLGRRAGTPPEPAQAVDVGAGGAAGIPDDIRLTPEGRLILVGGQHAVGARFADPDGIDAATVDRFHANHAARRDWCARRGIAFGQWVFPDPIVYAPGDLPGIGPGIGPVRSLFEARFAPATAMPDLHYPIDLIAPHPDRQMRTDTHYSGLGRLHLAAAVAERTAGFETAGNLRHRGAKAVARTVTGDLGARCDPPRSERSVLVPPPRGLRCTANGLGAGNLGIIQLVTNPHAKRRRKLLIFGDSFLRSMLLDLACFWSEIVFLRTPHFHYEMVDAVAPDAIVMGMAERYLHDVAPDADRPHMLAYPLVKGRTVKPRPDFAELWGRLVDQAALARTAAEAAPPPEALAADVAGALRDAGAVDAAAARRLVDELRARGLRIVRD